LIHAVAVSLAVGVMVLNVSLVLAVASTQASIAMPFAH
jgi:hypothetical protein